MPRPLQAAPPPSDPLLSSLPLHVSKVMDTDQSTGMALVEALQDAGLWEALAGQDEVQMRHCCMCHFSDWLGTAAWSGCGGQLPCGVQWGSPT